MIIILFSLCYGFLIQHRKFFYVEFFYVRFRLCICRVAWLWKLLRSGCLILVVNKYCKYSQCLFRNQNIKLFPKHKSEKRATCQRWYMVIKIQTNLVDKCRKMTMNRWSSAVIRLIYISYSAETIYSAIVAASHYWRRTVWGADDVLPGTSCTCGLSNRCMTTLFTWPVRSIHPPMTCMIVSRRRSNAT